MLMFFAFATHAATVPDLMRIPGGHIVPRGCITALPNRAVYDASSTKATLCNDTLAHANIQIYAADVHMKTTEPLTNFTTDFVVPPLPSERSGQVVYFWPGFKASAPEMGYPVLQPVLQYGEHGGAWALQSWFVDAKDWRYPVVTAPAIDVSPGDHITTFMSLSPDGQSWTVSGTNMASGEDTTLHIKYKRAGKTDYHYAMLVNENINVNTDCGRMPASSALVFTNVSVDGRKGSAVDWTTRANCKGDPQCDCGNDANVDATSGDVTLSWKSG